MKLSATAILLHCVMLVVAVKSTVETSVTMATGQVKPSPEHVILHFACTNIDLTMLDRDGHSYVAQAMEQAYNAVHQPITGNFLDQLAFVATDALGKVSTPAAIRGNAKVAMERQMIKANPAPVSADAKATLEGVGDFCGGKDLQALLGHDTLALHRAWEALFTAHLNVDHANRFVDAIDCKIDIALTNP